jgi:preprotein translocase subunit YajC
MADEKALKTILNQRQGKIILPPDPEELKKDPKAKPREVLAGRTVVVTAAEAAKLLNHRGLVDADTLATSGPSLADVQAQLQKAEAENAELRKKLGAAAADEELGDGDEVVTPSGMRGVIVKMKKKGKVDVKLANGATSEFALKDLKAAEPEPAAA